MKFSVCIPTRNRPQSLSAVFMALTATASSTHEITYVIGFDNDNSATPEAIAKLKQLAPIKSVLFDDSYVTLGQRWNALAAAVEADIYMTMTDDAFPLTPRWDVIASEEIKTREVIGWMDNSFAGDLGNGFISNAWYKACGYLCIEHFPFWFADTWLKELYQFAFDRDVLISPRLRLGGERGTSTNLRELDWWWGFYYATRGQRLREAFKLAKASDTAPGNEGAFISTRRNWIDAANARDLHFRADRIAKLEEALGDKSQPSARYLKAKTNAAQLLNELRLQPWEQNI